MSGNMYTANQDIRDYMADHGVSQRMLAAYLNTNQTRISTMLRKELSESDKQYIIRCIDAISNTPAIKEYKPSCKSEETEEVEEIEEVEEAQDVEEAEEVEETTTVSAKFQIGDRVKIPSKSLVIGIVSDIWHSLLQNKMMYAVDVEGGSRGLFREDQLEPAPLPIEYSFSATIENNVAVVCMIAKQGEQTWVHARGHAHILQDGAVGEAQAVSYAAKRMFESLDTQQKNRIYFK